MTKEEMIIEAWSNFKYNFEIDEFGWTIEIASRHMSDYH